MNPQMDQNVINLAKAIRQTESGGNFNAKGGSGESGAYQFMPDTWRQWSGEVLGNPNAEMTPSNQNAVAYQTIKKWKDAGLNPAQIAAKWNSGSEVGWENKRGVNSAGVAYDVPKYVASVTSAYQKVKAGSQVGVDPNNPSSTGYQPPMEPEAPEEPFSFKKMLAEAASPLATSLARPFQAAQLGVETIRQNRENPELEANSQKYADESYKLSLQARTMPPGPARDAIMKQAESKAKLGQYYAERLSDNASYKPFSTDTLIKEGPESLNWENMRKEVGRGVQTAAFGLGPVSGGTAFGVGMSMEQGNELLSFDTALYAAFGAAGGKALDIIGKPILNATGKVIGVVTPQVLQNVAQGGARAVQSFMERNKLLPDVVSKSINRGAGMAETAANAPFKAAAAPFRQTDDKIIATREKALSDLEEKYAQLRENAARNPKATAATRGRVSRSNVLTEEGMVNDDGVIIGAKQAAKNYRKETMNDSEGIVSKLLQKEGVSIDLGVVERELDKVIRESFNGRELISALNAAKREMAGLRLANRNGRISLVDVHRAKVSRQPGSKAYDNSEAKALDKQIARAHKQTIEKNSKENIQEINKEIGKYLDDSEYIESLQGKRIGSGKLGKAVAQVGGAISGAVVGGALGGLPGVAAGSYVGGSVSRKLASRGYRKAFGKPTKQPGKVNEVFEKAKARINEKQLLLNAGPAKGTSGNPIISGPRNTGPGRISVPAPKGEVIRNPKTGKFEKTYLSTIEPLPVQAAKKAIKKGSALESKHMAQIINNRAKEVISGKRYGYTSNLDGTEYTGDDAIATLQSKTLKIKNISPEEIGKIIKKNADIYGNNKNVKVGVFKMEDGSGISIDINVATADRKMAERIAKLNNQESYWDPKIGDGGDVVRTGGTGKQVFKRKDIRTSLKEVAESNRKIKSDKKTLGNPNINGGQRTPFPNQKPEYVPLETAAFRKVDNNFMDLIEKQRVQSIKENKGVAVINPDDFKPLVHDEALYGKYDPTKAQSVHEPASEVANKAKNLAIESIEAGDIVTWTAGGPGNGKGTALTALYPELYPRSKVNYDSVFGNIKKTEIDLERVINKGGVNQIPYVYTTIENGWKNIMDRAVSKGRTVSATVYLEGMEKAWSNIVNKYKKYNNTEGVQFYFADNSVYKGTPREASFADVEKLNYTNLMEQYKDVLHKEAKKALDEGKITEAIYKGLTLE